MANPDQRDRILDAAARVAAESGLGTASVRAVAKAAGIGMGTLRHYFPTQRGLYDALVERNLDATIQDFDIHDAARDPGDRLAQCVLQFLPGDAQEAPLLDAWFGLYRSGLEPGGSPLARQYLEVSTRRAHEHVASWLETLVGEGHLPSDRAPGSVLLLLSLVSGTCLELLTPGSSMTVDDARSVVSETARRLVAGS